MNNDFSTAKQFENAFVERLILLSRKWGVSEEEQETDPRLNDIRFAASRILMRTSLDLARLNNNSPYATAHAAYFESLKSPDYQPVLNGSNITLGTEEYRDAMKLLKDLAHQIGTTISRQQEALAKTREAIARAAAKDEALPEDPSQDAVHVGDASWAEWEQAITVPAALDGDEQSRFAEEARTFAQIVRNGSAYAVQNYLTETLGPRQRAITEEVAARRANYQSNEAFAIREMHLIDFKNSLDALIEEAMIKLEPPTVELVTPYPSLESQEPPATEAPTTLSAETVAKLDKLKSDLAELTKTRPNDVLEAFLVGRLVPKIEAVQKKVQELTATGQASVELLGHQHHLDAIQDAREAIVKKLASDKYMPTLTDVIPSPAPTAQAAPAQPKKPTIDEQLDAMRARIEGAIAAKSGKELQADYDLKFKPKMLEIRREITKLRVEGNNPELLAIKEKHFAVIRDGARAAHEKIHAEAVAAAETVTPESLRLTMNRSASVPLSAIYPSAYPSVPRAAEEKNYPVVVAAAANDAGAAEIPPAEAAPSAAPVKRLSSEQMAAAKANAQTVRVFGRAIGTEEPKKPMPWWKKAAVAVGGLVAAGAVAFVSFAIGLDHVQEQKAAERAAKYAAMSDFNTAAKAPMAMEAASATIIISTPANAVSTAPAADTAVDAPKVADTPAKASAADDTPKFAAAEPVADTPKTASKPVKTTAKAKADFKPAAANDATVTYHQPVVEQPFDILSMRADLSSLMKACKQAGVSGPNTVCGSLQAREFN